MTEYEALVNMVLWLGVAAVLAPMWVPVVIVLGAVIYTICHRAINPPTTDKEALRDSPKRD